MSILVFLTVPIMAIIGFVFVDHDLPQLTNQNPSRATRMHVRRTVPLQIGALFLAVLGIVVVSQLGSLGRGPLLAGTAGGLLFLTAIASIELSSRRPQARSRKASLETRRTKDYLPKYLTKVVAVESILLGVFSLVASTAGSPDDLGRAGRSLTVACGDSVRSTGPWPGTFYSAPAALAAVIGAVVALGTIRSVMARARIERVNKDLDDFTRRHTVYAVVAAYGAMISFSLLGLSAFASMALYNQRNCYVGVTKIAFGAPLCLLLFALFVLSWSCLGFGKNAFQLRRLTTQ